MVTMCTGTMRRTQAMHDMSLIYYLSKFSVTLNIILTNWEQKMALPRHTHMHTCTHTRKNESE